MKTTPRESIPRIDLIDALRGSALVAIVLLHSIQHWSFRSYPADPPAWLKALDLRTLELGRFLFEGKAYAIFALMFGVSFHLILDRWSGRGAGFRGRFLWRLAVLAVFGYLHGIVYCGDVLLPIAILGLPLLFLHRLGTRTLAWIAVALLLQIPSLLETGRVLVEPAYRPAPPQWVTDARLSDTFAHGSLLDVSAINAGAGQMARLWWVLESGRYAQMMGLFVCGLLLGRSRILEEPARCARPARAALRWGSLSFVMLHALRPQLPGSGLTDPALGRVDNLLASYRGLAQMAVWVGLFVLLHQRARVGKALNLLAPCGRMSLTCYVTQGLIGVPLFYGYGLALHRHLGPFHSVLFGAAFAVVQCVGAHLWLRRFRYGPLEWLWRCCTFLDFSAPLRRLGRAEAVAPGRTSA